MYARSTTMQAQPERTAEGIAFFTDEVLPRLREMHGFVGDSVLADESTGLSIVTTAWTTEQARAASADAVVPLRERSAAVLGATSTTVDEWEVAVLHRDHPTDQGACCRVTWVSFEPERTDEIVGWWRDTLLARLEAQDGFCSASFLIDRGLGRSVGTVTFEDRAALEASREGAGRIRANAVAEAGLHVLDVRELDLLLAHLHVPEMA